MRPPGYPLGLRAWLVLACTGDPQADAGAADTMAADTMAADTGAADAKRRRIWCASDDDAVAPVAWMPHDQRPQASGTGTGPGDEADRGEVRSGWSGRRVLVLGGARSGKSVTAERLLADHAHVDYIATGPLPRAGDAEWAARVRIHRERRPAGWRTIETLDVERELCGAHPADSWKPEAGAPAPAEAPAGASAPAVGEAPVLVDCLSTWLAGVMDECGLWTGQPGADQALARRMAALAQAWRATRRHVVAVSNEVGSGVVPATVSGRRFRDELGSLNARIAAECDEVWLCTAGIARRLR